MIKSPVQGASIWLDIVVLALTLYLCSAHLEGEREGGREVDSVLIVLCVFFAVKLERFVY